MYCVECNKEITPICVSGLEVYPHRPDLYHKYFYKCTKCGNYVGCHPNSKRPLGSIPNKEIKDKRKYIHSILDPLWKDKMISRSELYSQLSKKLGYTYHTGEINNIEEANKIQLVVEKLREEIYNAKGITTKT